MPKLIPVLCKELPTIKTSTKKAGSVKQTYFTSYVLDARLTKYCKDKGIKPPEVSKTAINDFLTNNNY